MSTNILETTLIALWSPRNTHCSTMKNQAMTKATALIWWYQFPQFSFHFCWLLNSIHNPKQITNANTMSVGNNSWLTKDITHHEIGTLSSHTRKG